VVIRARAKNAISRRRSVRNLRAAVPVVSIASRRGSSCALAGVAAPLVSLPSEERR
jgi:hypothetical protein